MKVDSLYNSVIGQRKVVCSVICSKFVCVNLWILTSQKWHAISLFISMDEAKANNNFVSPKFQQTEQFMFFMFTIAINCNQTYSLEIRVSNGVRFNQCENKMSLGKTFNKFLN